MAKLLFIDESGDTGNKLERGSSSLFVLTMLIFHNERDAARYDQEISKFKKSLGFRSEFHYAKNSDRIKKLFVDLVRKFDFISYSIVINKSKIDPSNLIYSSRSAFYQFSLSQLIASLTIDRGSSMIVTVDKSGNIDFRTELRQLFKSVEKDHLYSVTRLKQQESDKTNLLQMVDYISGIVNGKCKEKPISTELYMKIKKKVCISYWP